MQMIICIQTIKRFAFSCVYTFIFRAFNFARAYLPAYPISAGSFALSRKFINLKRQYYVASEAILMIR